MFWIIKEFGIWSWDWFIIGYWDCAID